MVLEYDILKNIGEGGRYFYPNSLYFAPLSNVTEIDISDNNDCLRYLFDMACYMLKLQKINLSKNNENYSDIDGVLYDKDGKTLIKYPMGLGNLYEIPDGVETIKNNAFLNCALTSVKIQKNVLKIEEDAFWGCLNLSRIIVDKDNEYYSDINGILFDKNKEILKKCPIGFEGSYIIPEKTQIIEKKAFCNCITLTMIKIPESVTFIGDNVFDYCLPNLKIIVSENNKYYSSDEYGHLYYKDK
ncbi:MAG: leucine-rich repeat domain-containing protein, partial [Ruminococcus sp.]|nr:leucine-rich repeat domain-containing protein [Ruminococcus sp.]